jgi:hypothetical protein
LKRCQNVIEDSLFSHGGTASEKLLGEIGMETAMTMEEIIEAAEKRGWRLSALSHVGAAHVYSCILERKKAGNDGFPVYALGDLRSTPKEALQSAWGHAQTPIGNVRVDARRSTKPASEPPLEALNEWLSRNVGYRIRLEDAFRDLIASTSSEDAEEWEI